MGNQQHDDHDPHTEGTESSKPPKNDDAWFCHCHESALTLAEDPIAEIPELDDAYGHIEAK